MMIIEDAIRAMAVIDGQNDGTAIRAAIVEVLYRKLLADPENFWEFYFDTLDAAQPSHTRQIAERLLREGAVNDGTSIADIPALVAWDARARQQLWEQWT